MGTLVFALLAAFWTGTSAVFSGMTLMTARRDVIVTGKVAGSDLDLGARRRILRAEWVPLRGALGLVSAMLGTVIAMLPLLAADAPATFVFVCILAALVPFTGAAFFLIGGLLEYQYLTRLLARLGPPESPAASQAPP
jgi:hypothetical protein